MLEYPSWYDPWLHERLVRSLNQLVRHERRLKDEGTIWEHAYAMGKRDGMRLALQHLTGDAQRHRDGLLDRFGHLLTDLEDEA